MHCVLCLLLAETISCQLATTQLYKLVFKKGIYSVPVGFLEVSIAEAAVDTVNADVQNLERTEILTGTT